MLATPDTSHVSFSTIYEPSEDSFLLLDTLSSTTEVAWLHERFRGRTPFAIEVGTGSGVVIAFLTANAEQIIGRPIISVGVDVNINACHATKTTVVKAIQDQSSKSTYLGSVNGDLCSSLRPGSVDILVFNPPYVPSEELPALPDLERRYRDKFEHDSHLLALTTDGGEAGMETTNRLLAQIPEVLSTHGVAYVLLCAQNNPAEVKRWIIEELPHGPWLAETVGSSGTKGGWEKLQIVRIWRDREHYNG
ncbi:S-adenosylmethionine-dependent methyltransferase [Knufia obscura]|uniref:S-adenosylmethionine-dependent methyltransferase n=2 Tax=Knufia TaxID=430999 RepID=A0AAN8E8H1_9EURO|nr:S-adenosylmethionine-dependent methyltransferase [Knufia obscura]KAK5948789.1 S-adenosylmethionine-dependent methyltransferase [Knufia fluminis]